MTQTASRIIYCKKCRLAILHYPSNKGWECHLCGKVNLSAEINQSRAGTGGQNTSA